MDRNKMQVSGQNPSRKDTPLDYMKRKRSFLYKQLNSRRCASQTESVKHLGKTDLGKSSRSASEELMKEEERAMERSNRKDDWLCEGIVVRVMIENGYYKQKGVVRKVIDRCVGEIEMLENKHVVRVDQKDLKTVLPKIGELVKIVKGAYRGSNARFLGINTEKFCPKVKIIENGVYDGRIIQAIDYEDICQVL